MPVIAAAAAAALFSLPDPPTAIVNARLIDGTGAPARAGCTVLIAGERIAAVGIGVVVPDGATVVDGKDMTVLPGMFDTHGHCFTVDGKDQYEAYPLLFLAGFFELSFSSLAQTLVQLHAPEEIRGRVLGLFGMASSGLRTFSGVTVGLAGSVTSIHTSLAASASTFILAVMLVWWARVRSVRPVDAPRA